LSLALSTLLAAAGQSVASAAAARDSARLDFRIAPTREGKSRLGDDQIKRYTADLHDHGPEAGRKSKEPYAWFETKAKDDGRLITAQREGRTYVLLSAKPDEIMLARDDPKDCWGLRRVAAAKDRGCRPYLSLELDRAGGERLAALSKANIERPLAILVDDRMLSAPILRSMIADRAEITGMFTEEEIQQFAAALRAGMPKASEKEAASPSPDRPAVAPVAEGLVRSEVLSREFARLLAGMVAEQKKSGGKMPEGWDTPQFVTRAFQELEKVNPKQFLVTPVLEKQFAAGKFDDAAAAEGIKQTAKVLKDFGVTLPAMSSYVLTQFQAGKLHGARLELARRMLASNVGQLIEKLR